jgi:hypothetical protein
MYVNKRRGWNGKPPADGERLTGGERRAPLLTTLLTLLAIAIGPQSHVALPGWFMPFVDTHITEFLGTEPIVCGAFSETETDLPMEMHRALECAATAQKLKQPFRVVQYATVPNGADTLTVAMGVLGDGKGRAFWFSASPNTRCDGRTCDEMTVFHTSPCSPFDVIVAHSADGTFYFTRERVD